MGSFLYPRTISVYRSTYSTAPGAQSYSAPNQDQTIATGLPASIQLKKERGKPITDLPGDASAKTFWTILIPAASAGIGLIRSRDIIVDELGVRYQVSAPYWNSLGYGLLVELLEA